MVHLYLVERNVHVSTYVWNGCGGNPSFKRNTVKRYKFNLNNRFETPHRAGVNLLRYDENSL
jgi:hypothetical protein